MKISAKGLLGRIRDGGFNPTVGHDWACGQLLEHLEGLAQRWKEGDSSAVDEFLESYCLLPKANNEERPT